MPTPWPTVDMRDLAFCAGLCRQKPRRRYSGSVASPFRRAGSIGRRLPLLLCWLPSLVVNSAWACPFCGPVGDSLARRRDAAGFVCIAEALTPATADASGLLAGSFRVIQVLPDTPGRVDGDPPERVTARVAAPVEGTAVLFGSADDSPRWTAVAADESLLEHVVTAPPVTLPAGERLAWFARRLEHRVPAIAEDAFTEFALAPYPDVLAAAAALADRPLARWVADPATDQRRRGFYGLALGIVAAADGGRVVSSAPLRAALASGGGDFRAGADGLMAGVLVADGVEGLGWLVERAGPDRPVDQRQLLAALRFAGEYLGDTIPAGRITAATARLAQSPAVAADAIIDLARREAWEEVDRVAGWWERAADDPLIRRAVAGYLTACPTSAAREHLDRIGREDPAALSAARAAADLPLGR